jgi:hypothetical protein
LKIARVFLWLIGVAALIAAAPSPTAHELFERGLLLYYSYDPQNAERAFEALASMDPGNASAYWGEALAFGPNINEALKSENFERAQRAIAQANAHAATADPKEQDLIRALSLRYAGNWDRRQADDDAYRAAMANLYVRYPSDDTIAMLYGEALAESTSMHWTADGKPGDDDLTKLIAVVQAELTRDPTQPMANHLCIHAYDQAPDRTPAVACAQRLDSMAFAPAAEHLAHMPAHTWLETGAYAKVLASSERAYALIQQLRKDPNADQFHSGYGDHDAYVAYEAAMMLGSHAQALRWQQRLGSYSDDRATTLQTLVRFARWADIAALPPRQRDATLAGARALAYLHLGNVALAKAALGSAARGELEAPLIVLARARLDETAGQVDAAAALLREQDRQQRAHYSAEFIPLLPAGEFLGGLYLRAGRYADAEAAFQATLQRYPQDPRALFGLARTLQAQGKSYALTDGSFDAAWRGADTDLSVSDL